MTVMIHFAVFADLALLELAAVNESAIAMAETRAAVTSVRSLTRIESGRHSHTGFEGAMR